MTEFWNLPSELTWSFASGRKLKPYSVVSYSISDRYTFCSLYWKNVLIGKSQKDFFSCHKMVERIMICNSQELWWVNGYPFQYSCLENSMDWGAWQVTVHKVAKIVKHNWATNTFTFSSLVDWILRLLIWQYFRDGVLLVTEIEKYCSIKMMKCTLWDAPNIKIRWRVGA